MTRYDLGTSEGDGVTVRFSLTVDSPIADSQPDAAPAAGLPARSVLPESFTALAAYKIAVTPEGGGETKIAYIAASGGSGGTGSISLSAVTAITVEVWAYSVWTDQTIPPLAENLILQKTGILFAEAVVRSGTLQITLNPLTDSASAATGGINLALAWPDNFDADSGTDGAQGITKVSASLLTMAGAAIAEFSDITRLEADFSTAVPHKIAEIAYNGVPAGSYKLRLTFYRTAAFGGYMAIGYFTEVVTVWPDSIADKWIDAAGGQHHMRLFTANDFYDATASVYGIVVKKDSVALPDSQLGSDAADRLVKADVAGQTVSFTIEYDAGTSPVSGKSLHSVTVFENGASAGSDITGNFQYGSVSPGSTHYVSSGSVTVPAGAAAYRVDICVQAPDRATTKTYTYTFATAMLSTAYYLTPGGAITAAAGGSETTPDEITVLADISMTTGKNIVISSGKYIKLISEAGQARTLKRAVGNISDLFTVNGHLTLESVIVDGGAVWTDGTATPPSPAFEAVNGGTGALGSGNATLVTVSGAGAKLTLSNGAILQNNCISNSSGSAHGGAVRLENANMLINGVNAEIRYNQAVHAGGAIATAGTSTLTLTNGKIHNNNVSSFDGGALQIEGSSQVIMNGGEITQNRARDGGGINLANCPTTNFQMPAGVISGNTATRHGSAVYVGDGTFTMSGEARIHANNDVRLASNKTITIGGTFTETPSGPVATITPASFTANTRVLANNTHLTEANSARFAVSNNDWYIQSLGTNKGAIHNTKAASRTVDVHTLYYPSLREAADAVPTGGSIDLPNVITVVNDISQNGTIDISNRHIRLTVPPNTSKTIQIANADQDVFKIQSGSSLRFTGNGTGNLTIDGRKSNGVVFNTTSLIYVAGGGSLFLEDNVNLCNTKKTAGGPIHIAGAFTMSGGKITGMEGIQGGAVHVGGGTFTMSGGEISGNASTGTGGDHGGGGVYVEQQSGSGSFTMNGGEIKNNVAEKNGGGVLVRQSGTFEMPAGTISNNEANDGGGIAVIGAGATFTMSGSAAITGNKTNSFGGGIRISSGAGTMDGGTISGNMSTDYPTSLGTSGGVFVSDTGGAFTMTDGNITGNSADTGGGVRIGGNGTFTMSGGTIGGNTAQRGGGVRVDLSGKFIKNGGGTIFGTDDSGSTNTAGIIGAAVWGGSDNGSGSSNKYRNVTAGPSVRMYYSNGNTTDPNGNVNTLAEWVTP
ncbi:MAG: hypothetical protein LBD20_03540 [Spirochaetaceae bacterium]|nr:hypothetical protein [Spirochaetaceae bacterium]